MTTVALTSVHGAPGVTTTALLLASRLAGSVLVEADLAGGVLAVRYQLGREPGLTTLAAARPQDGSVLFDHAQDAGGVPVLVGPDVPESAQSLWRAAGARLAAMLSGVDGFVVVDIGRISAASPMVGEADLVVVMIRPIAEQIVGLTYALNSLRQHTSGAVGIVVVGDGPYRINDIEAAVGSRVLAQLPTDTTTAEHLLHGAASQVRIARSPLGRAVAGLGDDIETLVGPPELVSP